MSDRLIEIVLPAEKAARLRELIEANDAVQSWPEPAEGMRTFKLLVPAERVEGVLDPLQAALGAAEGFRAVVLSVEAALPQPEPAEEKSGATAPEEAAPAPGPERISREELYEDLSGYARTTRVFLCTVVLSAIVAAIGLVRDSPAIVIGAMVIAPLLGPNAALALATTLGDAQLTRRALKTNAIGLLLATIVAFIAGLVLDVDVAAAEIASRTEIGLGDLVLALAAGVAGALAFTTGVPSALVGVMVAVALLPPLVVFGMLLAAAQPMQALNALMLVACNLVGINLAGVATFLVQGVSPRKWWEAERSKKIARRALAIWIILLITLAALVLLSRVSTKLE